MTSALDLTLAAVAIHVWQVVLLGKQSKKPAGDTWNITSDVDVIRRHVERGGNHGLVCGPVSRTDVLDFDDLAALDVLFAELGELVRHVRTGSGKVHCYVRHEDGLPASLRYHGRIIGQIQRGPGQQQVVTPPSIHPKTLQPYQWLVDPRDPLPILPAAWRTYLMANVVQPSTVRPNSIIRRDTAGVCFEVPWDGPPAEELLRRAMLQPGARHRSLGVKFQCPGCRAEGRDRHQDNAIVRNDGRWGCAVNSGHSRAIAGALGVVSDQPQALTLLRGLSGLGGL